MIRHEFSFLLNFPFFGEAKVGENLEKTGAITEFLWFSRDFLKILEV